MLNILRFIDITFLGELGQFSIINLSLNTLVSFMIMIKGIIEFLILLFKLIFNVFQRSFGLFERR